LTQERFEYKNKRSQRRQLDKEVVDNPPGRDAVHLVQGDIDLETT
jgi:hypothetical protein